MIFSSKNLLAKTSAFTTSKKKVEHKTTKCLQQNQWVICVFKIFDDHYNLLRKSLYISILLRIIKIRFR